MAEQLLTTSVAAPGFFGLNLQESSVSLSTNYALEAFNCVIDKYGRVGARKGWTKVNATNADLSTGSIKSMFEVVRNTGTNVFLSAGNNKLFTGTTTLTKENIRNAPNTANVSVTITDDNWQFGGLPYGEGVAALSHAYAVQAGHPMLVYHQMPVQGSGATASVASVSSGKISSLTITAAGTNYAVNDILTPTGGTGSGAVFTVSSINGSGGITGLTITNQGDGYTVSDSLTLVDNDYHSHEDGWGFQRVGDIGTLPTGYSVNDWQPDCMLAAYGRIWVANISGDQQTVYFSNLLDGSNFNDGDAGFINIGAVVPNNDTIVALAAHNGFLIIFTKQNIVIYNNALDVANLTLQDMIQGIGCVARDSVQNTGTDLIFLSDTGVRSLMRVIQEKSAPMRDLSKNVRDELMINVAAETAKNIKSIYFDREAFYLLALPTTKYVYCFDMRGALEDGSSRVTIWTDIQPTAFAITQTHDLYIGRPGYIGKYTGYQDDGALYNFRYYTTYTDLGAPIKEKMLKQIGMTIIGGSGASVAVKWGFDFKGNYNSSQKILDTGSVSEYNIAQYTDPTDANNDESVAAYYAGGFVISSFKVNATGKGVVVQIGIETDINGNSFSIQKLDMYLKQGKTV